MDARLAPDHVDEHLTSVLNALGAAWITFQLYPNPSQQPPFQRSVDVLNAEAGLDPIGIGPGVFIFDDVEIAPEREGVEKLARQMFLHDVEQVMLVAGATAEGLAAFFTVISQDDEEIRAAGGVALALAGASGSGLAVRQRGLLHFGAVEGGPSPDAPEVAQEDLDGLSTAARIAFGGASPDEIAESVVEVSADTEATVQTYVEAYHQLHDRIALAIDGDEPSGELGVQIPVDDPYKTVRAFIEAFFHLPRWVQISILMTVLEDIERRDHQMFLDQFSGQDLTHLLADLSGDAAQALMRYAVSASTEPGGHPLDLLAGLQPETEVDAARRAVADRVTSTLRQAKEGAFSVDHAAIRDSMEAPFDVVHYEIATFFGLFECEHRRDRFQRLVRVWTGRVARYIRDGDLVGADRLLNTILDGDPYSEQHADAVGKALERMATPDLLRVLALREEDEQSDAAAALLSAFGSHVIDQLVVQLGGEEDRRVRRQLTEMVASAARDKPRALEPYLSDHRWYLVRNLATALGRTGNPDAMSSLRLIVNHSDHRVRTEVLRSAVRLQRPETGAVLVKALSDPHDQVRHTSATLLSGSDASDLDRLLADELRSGRLPADSSVTVIMLLGSRGRPLGRQALEEVAAIRFAFRSQTRAEKRAARRALRGAA